MDNMVHLIIVAELKLQDFYDRHKYAVETGISVLACSITSIIVSLILL